MRFFIISILLLGHGSGQRSSRIERMRFRWDDTEGYWTSRTRTMSQKDSYWIGRIIRSFGLEQIIPQSTVNVKKKRWQDYVMKWTEVDFTCSSGPAENSTRCRLVIFLPPMLTFLSCSSRASDMIRSRKMLKRVGDRRHPCLTPTVVLNHYPMLPFIWTALVALS